MQSMSGPFRIGDRFAEERRRGRRTSQPAFDPCIEQPAVAVDKYQTVIFDGNRYSVPEARRLPVGDGQGLRGSRGGRRWRSGHRVASAALRACAPVLDPLHYVAALARRPAALDHAPVFRDWKLPAGFLTLRAALEERHGELAGTRHFIQVLQLLNTHPHRWSGRSANAGPRTP